MSDINWDVELRKLERQLDGLPPEPSSSQQNTRRAAERRTRQREDSQSAVIGASARVSLVAALAAALAFWPYARECGAGLFLYLGAQAVVAAGALWVVAFTWRTRMAKTHALALVMVVCGLALVAAQVLPRVGYANVDPSHPPRWRCSVASR
jgi:hypothetical protein